MRASNRKTAHPKYLQIADHIRGRIHTGKWVRGERIASVADLCEQFATSATVVDRALFVLDQEGIIQRQQGRGVFVAERKPKALKNVIGLQWPEGGAPDRSGHYGSDIIRGIELAAHRHGFELMLLNSNRTDYRDLLDGVVFADPRPDQLTAARIAQTAAVSILVENHDVPTVTADDFGGTRLAVKHLVGHGHRRIACLMWPPNSSLQRDRLQGYLAGLSDAGIEPDTRWSKPLHFVIGCADMSQAGLTQANIEEWIRGDWADLGCTAILCQNDDHAAGALRAFAAAGLRVPRDVSVVGFDGTSFGELTSPRLTSVAIPLERIGETAAEMLIRSALGDEQEMMSVVLKAGLIVRESTGAAPQ